MGERVCLCAGWNASDVESWFTAVIKNGVVDRTLQYLRTYVSSVIAASSVHDARDVENRMRYMPPAHVAFLCCVSVTEMERTGSGNIDGIMTYLKSANRPEGAATGNWRGLSLASPGPLSHSHLHSHSRSSALVRSCKGCCSHSLACA